MMADGIRPILDRLDEIEEPPCFGEWETGDEPVPSDVQGWLSTQMTDTFRGDRGGGREECGTLRTDSPGFRKRGCRN